jgi:TolB-like protein/DNA-binding winged helix-turn-helix (wHTH) protein/Flp pilus assembly protein TadD
MGHVAGEASRNGEFRLGDWLVRPGLNQLSREDTVVHLRPKVMNVLVHLAEHGSGVVSKEELIDAVWAKEFLADSALSRAVFELREGLGDDAQQPRYIETIPKRGYRLLAPVVREEDTPVLAPAPEPAPVSWRVWRVRLAVLALFALVVGTTLVLRGRVPTPGELVAAAPRKLVVLPFENLGPPEDEYLAAGITDEISGRLASVTGLSVISRTSAAQYARTTKTTKEIAQELGVDYLLAGTIRWDRSGGNAGRVRIIPRLIRVADDTHLWADVYDRVIVDVFAVQTEIAEKVSQQLDLTLRQGERDALGRVPTSSPEAYKAYLQGNHHTSRFEGEEAQRLAITMYERAVELDPGFAVACSALSRAHGHMYNFGFDRTETRRLSAKTSLDRALALAPDDPDVRLSVAWYNYVFAADSGKALAEINAAEKRAKPSRDSLTLRGYVLRRLGRFLDAREKLVKALELSPRDYWLEDEIAITDMYLGRWEDADRHLARSIELTADQHTAYEWKATNALLWKGSLAQSRVELSRMPLLQRPDVAFAWWRQEVCEGDLPSALERLDLLPGEVYAQQFFFYPRALMEADVHTLMGDRSSAQAGYDAARVILEREAVARPEDPRIPSALGLAYAGLGRPADALREGDRARAMSLASKHAARAGFAMADLARIHLMTGDLETAARLVETLLTTPTHPDAVPLVWLDPRWARLRDHPRLRSLTVGRPRTPEGR